jgi:hypothetical protein
MKARALIEGASFGSETVKAMWDVGTYRAPIYSDVPGAIKGARITLAEAILSVTTEGSTDVAALKANAVYAISTGN